MQRAEPATGSSLTPNLGLGLGLEGPLAIVQGGGADASGWNSLCCVDRMGIRTPQLVTRALLQPHSLPLRY